MSGTMDDEIKRWTALRKAALILEGGAEIRYIQAVLGQAGLSTTETYPQVSIQTLQASHAAIEAEG